MKKFLFIIISLFCFVLIACNSKQEKKLDSKIVDNTTSLEYGSNLGGVKKEQEMTPDTYTSCIEENDENRENNCYNEKTSIGKIYSLQEAFELGILSIDDIKYIGDIQCEIIDFNEKIDIDIEQKIKNDYLYKLINDMDIIESSVDAITIIKYFGKYNDAYVVGIKDNYSIYIENSPHYIFVGDLTSGLYGFKCGDFKILVWSEKI